MREPVKSDSADKHGWLVRVKGSGGPARYRLRPTGIRVGRDPQNDIVIDASTTSSHHSEISWERGSYWIYDLNSKNGTYINGSRVDRAPLKAESRIRFGTSGPEFAVQRHRSPVDETVEASAIDASRLEELESQLPVETPASSARAEELESQLPVETPASSARAEELESQLPVETPAPATRAKELDSQLPVETAAPTARDDEKLLSDDASRAREARSTGPKDFFVSYTKADLHWAEWIAWQLEQAGFSTVIQAWDFRPGSNFMIDMQRAAEDAARTIAVLSPDYLESAYAQQEWASALAADPTGKSGKLLPVRVRECQPKGLLTQVVYVDLVGLSDLAASNTLLSGVNRGRAKPGAPPQFPSASAQSPNFPGEAAAMSAGEGATAVPAEPPPVVHIAISCPSELLGTEYQNITIDFEVVSPSARVSLIVEQEAFLVTGEGSAAGGEFIYNFTAPGRYRKKLRIYAKQSGGANHPLGITGYAAGQVMLVRGSYVIRIIEPALISRIVSLVKRYPLASAASFLAVCGLSFLLMPGSARLWLLLHANPMTPANYLQGSSSLPGKHDWNDSFLSPAVTKDMWLLTNAQAEPGRLLLSGPGLVLPKKDLENHTFTDFGGMFLVTILKGNRVNLLLRVQPAGTAEWKRAYLFRIELEPESPDGTGGSSIRLTGLKCSSPGLEGCVPLVSDSAPVIGATACKDQVVIHISVRAEGNVFTLWPMILGGLPSDEACGIPNVLGKFSFRDEGFWPHSLYGNVGFAVVDPGNSVSIESFQIIELDKLEGVD